MSQCDVDIYGDADNIPAGVAITVRFRLNGVTIAGAVDLHRDEALDLASQLRAAANTIPTPSVPDRVPDWL